MDPNPNDSGDSQNICRFVIRGKVRDFLDLNFMFNLQLYLLHVWCHKVFFGWTTQHPLLKKTWPQAVLQNTFLFFVWPERKIMKLAGNPTYGVITFKN